MTSKYKNFWDTNVNFNIDFTHLKKVLIQNKLYCYIDISPGRLHLTTPHIKFGLPCVYSTLLKFEILHTTSPGTCTPCHTIGQRLIHNFTLIAMSNNNNNHIITQKKDVLMWQFTCARAVNTPHLFMRVTGRHADRYELNL